MKMFRGLVVVLSLVTFIQPALAGEDFVFHCSDNPKHPVWSAFSIIPTYSKREKDPKYQLIYFGRDRKPRILNLAAPEIDNQTFRAEGKIELPATKARGLINLFDKGSREATALAGDKAKDTKIMFHFDLIIKIDQVALKGASEKRAAQDNPESAQFTYMYKVKIDDSSAKTVNSTPACIRSGLSEEDLKQAGKQGRG